MHKHDHFVYVGPSRQAYVYIRICSRFSTITSEIDVTPRGIGTSRIAMAVHQSILKNLLCCDPLIAASTIVASRFCSFGAASALSFLHSSPSLSPHVSSRASASLGCEHSAHFAMSLGRSVWISCPNPTSTTLTWRGVGGRG